MSNLERGRYFAIGSFLDKKAFCKGYCVNLATRVIERTIDERVFISLSFLLHFLANCCINY